jgi:hypothetical protein
MIEMPSADHRHIAGQGKSTSSRRATAYQCLAVDRVNGTSPTCTSRAPCLRLLDGVRPGRGRIPVSVCAMAGDPAVVPVLLGLGLTSCDGSVATGDQGAGPAHDPFRSPRLIGHAMKPPQLRSPLVTDRRRLA